MLKRSGNDEYNLRRICPKQPISRTTFFQTQFSLWAHHAKIEEKLLATLSAEQKETFKELIDAQAEISLLSGTDRFIYGYRLGLLMTMEVFNGKDDVISAGSVNNELCPFAYKTGQ